MSNITTCIDSSRPVSEEDQKLLDEKFKLMEEAHRHLYDPETGTFRTMAEALKIVTEK